MKKKYSLKFYSNNSLLGKTSYSQQFLNDRNLMKKHNLNVRFPGKTKSISNSEYLPIGLVFYQQPMGKNRVMSGSISAYSKTNYLWYSYQFLNDNNLMKKLNLNVRFPDIKQRPLTSRTSFLIHSSPLKKCIISAVNIVVMQLTSNSGIRRNLSINISIQEDKLPMVLLLVS